MKQLCLAFVMLLPAALSAQTMEAFAPVRSTSYTWKKPHVKTGNLLSTVIFQGRGYDMEYVQMSACELLPSRKKTSMQVPADEEHLIIVKSGPLDVSFKDSTWSLGAGSIALLMPEEKYTINTSAKAPVRYYLMKYRSKAAPDLRRAYKSGGSFVREWSKRSFRKHDRGGVRPYFETATAMCRRFEMHVTTLNAGVNSHDPHTHQAEEIVLMLEDTEGARSRTEMQIGDQFFQGEAGDMYYVGSNLLHGIRNNGESPCSYFAFQFE